MLMGLSAEGNTLWWHQPITRLLTFIHFYSHACHLIALKYRTHILHFLCDGTSQTTSNFVSLSDSSL